MPALAALASAVLLLHGWVIERIAGAARPQPREAARASRAIQAVMAAPLAPDPAGPVPVMSEPPAAATVAQAPAASPTVEAAPQVNPPATASKPARRRGLGATADAPPAAPPPVATLTSLVDTVSPSVEPAATAEPPPATSPAEPTADPLLAAASQPAASGAADDGTPPPVYRTRIPPPAKLTYRLSRSGLVGVGELDWQPQGRSYILRLEGRLPPLGTLIVQTSRGGFDAAGLAPERHTDRRLRRGEQAANFQRDKGRISFSGPDTELPLLPGVQDRLSVMLQLAAIANAWSRPPAVGSELRIQVVGARGDAHVWTLRYGGPQPVQTAAGSVTALYFLREPAGPYDTRAEFWLDGARSYLPVRVRLTDGRGEALELLCEPPVP